MVLAIDLSDSTIEPCGIDLDGDGEAGATNLAHARVARGASPTCASGSSTASRARGLRRQRADGRARRGVRDREPGRTRARFRVGIVAFSSHAWVVAPARQLQRGARRRRSTTCTGTSSTTSAAPTSPRGARRGGERVRRAPPAPRRPRARSCFLSDGANAGVRPRWDIEERALEAARARGAARPPRVRVRARAGGEAGARRLPRHGRAHRRALREARPADARRSRGSRAIDFAEVAGARRRERDERARRRARCAASRTGASTRSSTLAPGANRLRFTARARNGTSEVAERVVRYDAAGVADRRGAGRRGAAPGATSPSSSASAPPRRASSRRWAARRPVQRREIELRAEAARRAARPAAGRTRSRRWRLRRSGAAVGSRRGRPRARRSLGRARSHGSRPGDVHAERGCSATDERGRRRARRADAKKSSGFSRRGGARPGDVDTASITRYATCTPCGPSVRASDSARMRCAAFVGAKPRRIGLPRSAAVLPRREDRAAPRGDHRRRHAACGEHEERGSRSGGSGSRAPRASRCRTTRTPPATALWIATDGAPTLACAPRRTPARARARSATSTA